MWVLLDKEAKKLVTSVKGLDAWCYEERHMNPEDLKFELLVYAEGLRDGIAKVLEAMGVGLKDTTKQGRHI